MSKEPVILFKVKDTTERMDITKKGEFTRYYEILAETKSGIEFTVRIPKTGFTKEAALKLIEKEATELEATQALRK